MPLENPQAIVDRLLEFQRLVRELIMRARKSAGLHEVARASSADTIYRIDAEIDPVLDAFCQEWGKSTPLVLIAEGLADENGEEVAHRVFPHDCSEHDAVLRVIVDPIDGTRGIMYDKRAAWSLAGVAPNKGLDTRLQDIEVAAMTELPTSKMGFSDVLWAVKGQGAHAARVNLTSGETEPVELRPSTATGIDHGFASVSNFFPGTKVLASELMEHLVSKLIGAADVPKATVFDDQYISTGGQFYELIVGHDRFIADLRPVFYRANGQPEGMCCHPYDCAAWLIAAEAGVVLTDERGRVLDGPLDTTTGISWVGYANDRLRRHVEPLIFEFLRDRRGIT